MKTKPPIEILFFSVIVLATGLACRAATRLIYPDAPLTPAAVSTLPPTFVSPTLPSAPPTAALGASCQREFSAILKAALNGGQTSNDFPNINIGDGDSITLVTYIVNGDRISDPHFEKVRTILEPYQQNAALHQQAWDLFTTLIPASQRDLVQEYQIFTDGPDNLLAAVEQTYDDPNRWMLEVDVADISNTKNLAFTLVHEFGHLLTLNPSQVPPDLEIFNNPDDENLYRQEANACPNYFPGEGCSLENSYVNQFFDRFWTDIYGEWQIIDNIQNDQKRLNKLDTFYRKYRDQFVDDYAPTNPSEDIAETWAFFLLNPKPEGNSIAEQKILFFYDYPELARLREQILQNLCAANP